MKTSLSIVSFFFLVLVTSHAQNLVQNGSFEQFKVCPGYFSQRPADFTVTGWQGAGLGVPDHFHYCSKGEASVPYNWAGVSEAYQGDGYAGIFLWMNDQQNYREYLQTKLLLPLAKDSTYYVEFHYKLSSYSNYSIDRIGLTFTSNAVSISHDSVLKEKPALFIRKDSAFTTSTGTWEAARFEYKAVGNEQFLLIGNFDDNPSTKNYKLRSRSVSEPMLATAAYYYIDAVLVVPKYKVRTQLARNIAPGFAIENSKTNTPYVLKNIHFESNSASLRESSFEELDKLAQYLAEHSELKVEVAGHTDDVGDIPYNKSLSAKRAEAVADYLISKQVHASRISTIGHGEGEPLIHSTSEDARSINRRVEVKFIK